MALAGIVTSDWHLMGMKKIFPTPIDKQIIEINKPYEHAIERGIKHIFVPGDMSDVGSLGDDEMIALVMLLLTYDEHVTTYYTLGNHDVESVKKNSMNVLKLMSENGMFKNFHVFFKPTVKTIDGVTVCFLPFPHTEVLKTKKPPLVFAHVETVGALGDNGMQLHMKTDTLIRQPGDFVFSGHIHQHQHLKAKRFAYCGSLYQKNFGESLPKGFIEFEAKYGNGDLKVSQEFVNSKPNFTLETKLIESAEDWKTLSHDDSIRYKILVGDGVITPRSITNEYRNIIYLQNAGSKKRINMGDDGSEDQGGVTLKDIPTISITTGLSKYLKEAQFNKRQMLRAKEFVKEARSTLRM